MNKDTFTQKATELRPRMLAVARRLLGNDEDAEDAVQDTLLRLWQVRDKTLGSVDAFAMTMLRNICIDRLRRMRPTVNIDIYSFEEQAEAEQAGGEAETIDRVMKMVQSLPSKQQAMLRMRHVDGLKMSEIALMIGASEVSVRQTLSRARRRIYMAITAAVALLVGLGTALRIFTADDGICVTYENGRTITDRAVVMANMEQTMVDIFQSADVPDIDKQMNDILN